MVVAGGETVDTRDSGGFNRPAQTATPLPRINHRTRESQPLLLEQTCEAQQRTHAFQQTLRRMRLAAGSRGPQLHHCALSRAPGRPTAGSHLR